MGREIGQPTSMGIGGDSIVGSGFLDILELFQDDKGTEAIVMIGEIGGHRGGGSDGVHQGAGYEVDCIVVSQAGRGTSGPADGPRGGDHFGLERNGGGEVLDDREGVSSDREEPRRNGQTRPGNHQKKEKAKESHAGWTGRLGRSGRSGKRDTGICVKGIQMDSMAVDAEFVLQ